MRTLIAWLRSLAFSVVFYGVSLPWVCVALCTLALGPGPFTAVALAWSRFHRWCTRWILGQRVVIEGVVPAHPQFCVLKHEAMFETLDLPNLLTRPIVAAKQELLAIPLWGRAARAYGIVGVDRAAGAAALRKLRTQARAAMAEGRPLCLFPEGTRVPHGERAPLKSGFAGLYAVLGVPVVPIAVDSGLLNRKGHFIPLSGRHTLSLRCGNSGGPGPPRGRAAGS